MFRIFQLKMVVMLLALGGAGSLSADEALAKPAKKATKSRAKRPPPAAPRAPPPEETPRTPAATSSDLVPQTDFRGPTRIDFDDRLIQGQTNKSGAVYLFDRKETGISSMVRRRKSFRHLTIATIYDR